MTNLLVIGDSTRLSLRSALENIWVIFSVFMNAHLVFEKIAVVKSSARSPIFCKSYVLGGVLWKLLRALLTLLLVQTTMKGYTIQIRGLSG